MRLPQGTERPDPHPEHPPQDRDVVHRDHTGVEEPEPSDPLALDPAELVHRLGIGSLSAVPDPQLHDHDGDAEQEQRHEVGHVERPGPELVGVRCEEDDVA